MKKRKNKLAILGIGTIVILLLILLVVIGNRTQVSDVELTLTERTTTSAEVAETTEEEITKAKIEGEKIYTFMIYNPDTGFSPDKEVAVGSITVTGSKNGNNVDFQTADITIQKKDGYVAYNVKSPYLSETYTKEIFAGEFIINDTKIPANIRVEYGNAIVSYLIQPIAETEVTTAAPTEAPTVAPTNTAKVETTAQTVAPTTIAPPSTEGDVATTKTATNILGLYSETRIEYSNSETTSVAVQVSTPLYSYDTNVTEIAEQVVAAATEPPTEAITEASTELTKPELPQEIHTEAPTATPTPTAGNPIAEAIAEAQTAQNGDDGLVAKGNSVLKKDAKSNWNKAISEVK